MCSTMLRGARSERRVYTLLFYTLYSERRVYTLLFYTLHSERREREYRREEREEQEDEEVCSDRMIM